PARGRSFCFAIYAAHRCDEAIAATRQGFNEPRTLSQVAQRLAQFVDRRVQTVVEVDKRVGRPDAGTKLVPGYYFARVMEQDVENAKRLFLQLHPQTLLMKFPGTQVKLESSKT